MEQEVTRCPWCVGDARMEAYHDHEWGVPVHDDRLHFEYIILDAFQAGLSWRTILYRRQAFHEAFAGCDPVAVAQFGEEHVQELLQNSGIIRNQQKIRAAITNAQAFLAVQQEYGSFDRFIWQFTDYKTLHNRWEEQSQVPATSPESDAMSKALKKRGFKFTGSTICYAYMQAAGIVNDHLVSCFRYRQLR